MARREGKGEEKRSEEVSDEPLGINQSGLKGSTQPAALLRASEQGFRERSEEPSIAAPHSCPCIPLRSCTRPGSS